MCFFLKNLVFMFVIIAGEKICTDTQVEGLYKNGLNGFIHSFRLIIDAIVCVVYFM